MSQLPRGFHPTRESYSRLGGPGSHPTPLMRRGRPPPPSRSNLLVAVPRFLLVIGEGGDALGSVV
ncbi:hypothetical protein RSAG8_09557, partial [Rhizoctonia solani AG-8 WAC10335]